MTMSRSRSPARFAAWLAWACLLLLAWLAYRPGLSGGFLFDDFVNLTALGETGPVDDARTFWRYVTSGVADPTGRPLALLSFLIDARDWPADPAPFLRTNLLLHLANASLLFLLLRRLGAVLGAGRRDAAAALGAAMWLLHPLLVSTTLYVVQREAMLPASFVLLGLLGYVHGRARWADGARRAGLAWMLTGIVIGGLLATLCKANGILLPLLAWVLEATVLRGLAGRDQPALRKLRLILLVAPSLLVAAWLLKFALGWNDILPTRPWTIGERLLTEPRALTEYIRLLAVPSSVSTGLFNDHFQASRGLWSPPSTIAAIAFVAVLLGLGLSLRQRAPALSAAILFFFAGHVLESTSIPLELYFEHRNYLPALLAFWPLALVLTREGRRPGIRTAIAVAVLLLLAATTWQRARLWGEPAQLAELWAMRNPESSRAQAVAAITATQTGNPQAARRRLASMWERRPADLQLALNYVNAACRSGGIDALEVQRVAQALATAREGTTLARKWLGTALEHARLERCRGLDLAAVESWTHAAKSNPMLVSQAARTRTMASLEAMIQLARGRNEDALALFNVSLEANPTAETAAGQVAMLAMEGHYKLALRHLEHFEGLPPSPPIPLSAGMPWLHARVLEAQDYWPNELRILRSKLEQELRAAPVQEAATR